MVDSKTLTQILEDPDYRDILEGMKTQLLRLIRDGLDLGLLRRDEL
jgi:hypothetical protein